MNFRALVWLFLIFAFAGFLDASYLALENFRGEVPPCSLLEGCEIVTTSSYAAIWGVSVALLGSLYYLGAFLLGVRLLETENRRLARFASAWTVIGLIASIWFLYVQLGILRAVCIYCMLSILTSGALFICGVLLRRSDADIKF